MVQTCCFIGSPEAHPGSRRSTIVAQYIMLMAQGGAAKSRQHSAVAPSSHPICQVCGILPVLIDSIRLLPHDLWLSIIFFHVLSDCGSTVSYRNSLLEVILFDVCRNWKMKLLDFFPMIFAFECCCCMLRWFWIFCSLLQEIVPYQLICGL
jgi:hypothetical protein